MQTQQNIATMQQRFVIQIDSKTLNRVKPFDRQELVQAYLQLFSGFSWVNWTNGYSLGRAWQTALSQCDAFCGSKNDKNPAAKYLKATCSAHKKYWSQIIMTHKNRENTVNPKDARVLALREHGKRMIREAIDKINLILARYNEYTLDVTMSQEAQREQQALSGQRAQKAQQSQMPQQAGQAASVPQAQAMAKQVAMPQQARQVASVPQAQASVSQAQAVAKQVAMPQQVRQPQAQTMAKQVAMPQQARQVASVPQAQTVAKQVAMPQQARQAASVPQAQTVVKQVAMPQQVKQANVAMGAKQQVHKSVETQQQIQKTVMQTKKPYVAPTATVKQVQTKKSYERPTVSVRENQFAKPAQTTPKVADFARAQTQLKQRVNMFVFKNFNQRAA